MRQRSTTTITKVYPISSTKPLTPPLHLAWHTITWTKTFTRHNNTG